MNALIATVIVIGSRARVDEAAAALDEVNDRGGVRRVLISEGTETTASADEQDTTIRLDGLSPDYVDNAVAWLRLSSLPAVVWWRGGSAEALARLAHLADRLVLDTDPADAMWPHAAGLLDQTALTDLHWGMLTRWRSALAHLFDIPQVRAAASAYTDLEIQAADRAAARLFAGWLRTCLSGAPLNVRFGDAPAGGRAPLARVRLSGGSGPGLTLRVEDDRTCLEAEVDGAGGARVVPLGSSKLASRFVEEINVRTRDAAFERALVAAMETGA
ncbi:MAG TPA: OpcA/G6PD domain-containing protein [Vicinamibacterales bacterium]